jgi:hypothetical protein
MKLLGGLSTPTWSSHSSLYSPTKSQHMFAARQIRTVEFVFTIFPDHHLLHYELAPDGTKVRVESLDDLIHIGFRVDPVLFEFLQDDFENRNALFSLRRYGFEPAVDSKKRCSQLSSRPPALVGLQFEPPQELLSTDAPVFTQLESGDISSLQFPQDNLRI